MAGGMFTTADSSVLPEDILLRKKYAQSLLSQGSQYSPVGHPLAAVARALQGGMGGYIANQANQTQKEEQQKAMSGLMAALAGQANANPGVPDAGGTVQPQPMPSAPFNASKTGMFDPGDTEMQAGLITPVKYQPDVLDAAKKSGIDPLTYARQLQQESGFNSTAVSPKGATGIAQFMPATAAERGVNPNDPTSSIYGGADYLASLKQQFGGDTKLALMAYNWGPDNVKKWMAAGADPSKIPGETREYLARVLGGGGQSPQQIAQTLLPQGRPATSVAPPVQGGIPAGTMQVLRAATNPFLGSGGQAIAGKILEKQLTPRDQWVTQVGADGVPIQINKTTGEQKAAPRDAAIGEVEYARSNWQKLGFPDPNSQDPKAQNFWKEYNAKRLGGSGVNVQIDQSAPSEFEKQYGQGMGKRAIAVVDDGDKAQADLNNVRLTRALLQGVQTGKLANPAASIGSVLQAVGVDPAKFNIDPKLPATQEALASLVNNMTLGKIGAATGGMPANNFSDADRSFLTKIMPGLANRPEANEVILDAAERMAQLRQQKAIAWSDARAGEWEGSPGKKLSFEDFDRQWRKENSKKDIFGDLAQKIQAIGGAPQAAPSSDGWTIIAPNVRIREVK